MLSGHGQESKLIAGGHSLLPLMKLRLAQPSALVDIRGLPELSGLSESDGVLRIGAGVRPRPRTQRIGASPSTVDRYSRGDDRRPAGAQPGHYRSFDSARRSRRRSGWSAACHGRDRGRSGAWRRTRDPIADFFVDFWETALDPMEVLIEIRVPNKSGSPFSFHKFRQRSQDWAIVGVAAVGGGHPRVALMNMAMTPMRAHGVEQALASGATPAEAAAHADEGTSPSSDIRADAEYRRHLSRTLVRRALEAMTSQTV